MSEKDPYADIRLLPHHQSDTRPHMSLYDRAAQFAPFAALTGYEEMVSETAEENNRDPEPAGDDELEWYLESLKNDPDHI